MTFRGSKFRGCVVPNDNSMNYEYNYIDEVSKGEINQQDLRI